MIIAYSAPSPIKRTSFDAHALLHLAPGLRLERIILVVALKTELINRMTEVVPIPILAEVRDQVVYIRRARAERAPRREVDVADDFVHAHAAVNVAALARLLLELLGPALVDALLDAVRAVEAPSAVDVRLPDVVARVAAPAVRGGDAAVARAAVPVLALLVQLVEIVAELFAERVGHGAPGLLEARLEDVVCDVGLRFAANVHDVQTEDYVTR